MKNLTIGLIALGLMAACETTGSGGATAGAASGDDAKIAAYRATVAIPSGTAETPELRECLKTYAVDGSFQYGNSPETRWEQDVEPCLMFGPAPTKAELEAQAIRNPSQN